MSCDAPEAAAWRMLSMLDGLTLQAVAHREAIDRASVVSWSIAHAETELGLPAGSLGTPSGAAVPAH